MIDVEKIITDNPFVDNLIYYAKYLALNCVIKDEEEALKHETVESLKAGDLYIACVEGHAVYDMFPMFPREVLEKHLSLKSNLDLMVEDYGSLSAYLDALSTYERTRILDALSKLAQIIYVDHYDVMTEYINKVGTSWIDDNKELYDKCKNNSATYIDLFEVIPLVTRKRIITQYLNNYDDRDIDGICSNLADFQNYVDNRTDDVINTELNNISRAMRSVFQSHYETMDMRGYVSKTTKNNWYEYIHSVTIYDKCIAGSASYKDLYIVFPKDDLEDTLIEVLGQKAVDDYMLMLGLENLQYYFEMYSPDPAKESSALDKAMIKKYEENYNTSVNFDVYVKAKYGTLNYFDLSKYMPKETLKIILNTEIEEISNLDVYANNKEMLNSYLQSLDKETANRIKENITKDMKIWYVDNYVEKNNYYRTLIGLPPLLDDGSICVDTLYKTYDVTNKSFNNFGTKFVDAIPYGIYPDIHWRMNIYEFDAYDISILNNYGILEAYLYECKSDINDPRYKYFRFLGDNKLDLYTCRKAQNFQLISVPSIDNIDVRKKFIDKFVVNRDYVIRTVYSDAYKFESDYYNKFIIIFILINTIMDLLADIPKMIINREIFDAKCIKYLFESFGIPYYSEIPIKYQQAMLKNLNILIKYKSSTKNMIDICSLFGFDDIRVFGYYMLKERKKDSNTGEYLLGDDSDIVYDLNSLYVMDVNGEYTDYNGVKFSKLLEYREYKEDRYVTYITVVDNDGNKVDKPVINDKDKVYIHDEVSNQYIKLSDSDYYKKIKDYEDTSKIKFIKVPVNESVTDYKNDSDYIINYNEVVSEDDTWTGGLTHEYVEDKILDYEFNLVKTKYISVETLTDITEMALQVSYFYNMLFDNYYSEEALTVRIPYIKMYHNFKFIDVVCYLFALMYLYNGLEDNIMYSPTQILYIKGYNFNTDLNEVLKDSTAFTQPKDPMDRINIFDINDRIAEDNYNYQDAFKDYDIKAFDLNVDIDELDKWLQDNHQMSLDDFIVDDTLTTFNQIITIRQFYSLNNSYYQKSIFHNNLLPTQFNNEIKYAFGCELYVKKNIDDINNNIHKYVLEDDYLMECIKPDEDDNVYIMNNKEYVSNRLLNGAIYYKYGKYLNMYAPLSVDYYTFDGEEFLPLLTGSIYVKDMNGNYIFADNMYYTKNQLDQYEEITDDRYFYKDSNNKRIINFGNYYVKNENDKYVLRDDNRYILIEMNGEKKYILYKDAHEYDQYIIYEDDCYVLRSGKFIPLLDTDFFVKNEDGSYEYNEEECYIKTDEVTEYVDESGQYYKKLNDYYNESGVRVYMNSNYVKNPEGIFIPESDLLNPGNCYFRTEGGSYLLVYDYMYTFNEYNNQLNVKYALILDKDNNYYKYTLDEDKLYYKVEDKARTYVKDSNEDHILVLYNNDLYDDTKKMIVVFNKDVSSSNSNNLVSGPTLYNPEVTDKIWDENDWFYDDPSFEDNTIGMNGENKWYYRKPGVTIIPEDDEEEKEVVGSGFYLSSETYLGATLIEPNTKYYMSMDIETNFDGKIQIMCESDSGCTDVTCRVYDVEANEEQHIIQIFTSNNISKPRMKFLIYNFEEYPIENGDYIIVRNIKFVRAHSDNYIAQDIPSYDKLQELYKTNEAIYKYLVKKMTECGDYGMYQIYKKLFDSLMTSKYNKEVFKLDNGNYAKTYTEFLQTRDTVLYEKLIHFKSLDPDTMHKDVANNIIEVTYAIDDCVDTYSYGYLYSYFPAVSATYIQQYISKIINFFKSWKVHLLGINTVYKFDDSLDNLVKILEDQEYRNKLDNQSDKINFNHVVMINPIDSEDPGGHSYNDKYGIYFTHNKSDEVNILDRIKIIRKTADMITYDDNYENIHLRLSNEDAKVSVDENGDLIVSDNSGLSVAVPNKLILDDIETSEQFSGQAIDEINLDTIDII